MAGHWFSLDGGSIQREMPHGLDRTRGALGHRGELFRYPGPAPGRGRRDPAPASSRRCPLPAIRRLPPSRRRGSRSPPIRATAANAGCWRCSFTGCGRGAIGATAISAISRRCWRSSPISAARASGSIRCTRSSMTGPDARAVRIRRTAGCFSIRSTSTSRRSRNSTALMRQVCSPDIARLRDAELVDYPAVATLKLAAIARGVSEFCCERQRQAPRRLRRLPGGARPSARMLRRLRDVAAEAFRRMVGMAGAMAAAERRRAAPVARKPSRRTRLPRIPAMERRAPARTLPRYRAAPRNVDRALSRHRGRRRSAAAPTPGWTRTWCCADCRSARRPTSSIRPARTGASPPTIRTASSRDASSRSGRCCAPPCATPARSASTTCSA